MALNLQTLKTRSLTAVVFVAAMLVGLLWNFWSFLILFTIIHFGCWIEYLKLVEKITNSKIDNFIKRYFAVCGVVLMYVAGQQTYTSSLYWAPFGFAINVKYLFWMVLFIGLLAFLFQNKTINARAKWIMSGGFIYISLPFTLLLNLKADYNFGSFTHEFMYVKVPLLYELIENSVYPVAIIFCIWINDTMAYIVGSLIGKTPLSKVSPKKTWEGTLGGAVLCVLTIGFVFSTFYNEIFLPGWHIKIAGRYDWYVIAALCAIFGTIGDLFESKLKRMAGVKDSGSIMPGHGGFLDRFDSLLFAAPVVWVYVKLFM